jgi:hypothetical protein
MPVLRIDIGDIAVRVVIIHERKIYSYLHEGDKRVCIMIHY